MLSSESYIFDPRPDFPLVSTAKRYWQASSPYVDDPNAVTLIFTHGTGFHKEQWEPTIDELYRRGGLNIREVWTLDAPNHGDSALLNYDTLKWGYQHVFRWGDYGRSVHAFLTGLGTGVNVDFSKRRLVGIGHSMGAVALLLSMTFQPAIRFEKLILVEIMTMNQVAAGTATFLADGSAKRRDIWPSKEEAYKLLKARSPWKGWDDRVLRIYIDSGMTALPTRDYPERTDGITLKCPRVQETASYSDELGYSSAYRLLGPLTQRLPIHLIYGATDDYISSQIKQDVINNAAGRNLASVSRVPGAGHLAPQENPAGVAEKISECLSLATSKSKL
ncbi:alpha/beta-hydrolase [Hymenopellis radicata]|nr:alpha/beta-hydrolase [Hymenopellis radicata]